MAHPIYDPALLERAVGKLTVRQATDALMAWEILGRGWRGCPLSCAYGKPGELLAAAVKAYPLGYENVVDGHAVYRSSAEAFAHQHFHTLTEEEFDALVWAYDLGGLDRINLHEALRHRAAGQEEMAA